MSARASDDVQAKLERLGRLRRDGGALRDYQAPRWNEPLIMEQSVPGERGVLVPLRRGRGHGRGGRSAASTCRPRCAAPRRPTCPRSRSTRLLRHYLRLSQMTLGMDLGSDICEGTCTMKYSPKVHEELVRYHKHADLHPLAGRGDAAGPAADRLRLRRVSQGDLRHARPSRCSPAAARTPSTPTPA